MKWTPRRLKFGLNIYPPYLLAGIRVTRVDPGWRELEVRMKLRWYNRNAVGTHFGGSLYSMVDPHLMLMLMPLLGRDYVVWDQAASIRFVKPGKGTVRATIRISDEDLEDIRTNTAAGDAYRPEYELRVVDDDGETVAIVTKTLYIKKKPAKVARS